MGGSIIKETALQERTEGSTEVSPRFLTAFRLCPTGRDFLGEGGKRSAIGFFFSILKNNLIYFWLCWVFVALRELPSVAVASVLAEHRLSGGRAH